MAFTAELVDIARAGLQLNATVRYYDDATPDVFDQTVLNIQEGDAVTQASLRSMVEAEGARYKAARSRAQSISSMIGTKIAIT